MARNPNYTRRRTTAQELGLGDPVPHYIDAYPDSGEVPLSEMGNFSIPGRDEKGHSESIQFNVPPILKRHLEALILCRRFPYLSVGDLLRHSAYKHVCWLVNSRTNLSRSMIIQLNVILEACKDSDQRTLADSCLQKIQDKVDFFMRSGHTAEAIRLISVCRAEIKQADNLDHWSQTVVDMFDQMVFKPMLTAGMVPQLPSPSTQEIEQ